MKVGICLNVVDKYIGGGYSYARQIINYFNAYQGNHEFVFVLQKGIDNDLVKDLSIKNCIYFNPSVAEEKVENTLNKTGLQSALKGLEFVNFRFKIKAVLPFLEELHQKRKKIRSEAITTAFETFCKDEKIECLYYPQPEFCLSTQVPFITTVWDLGHHTKPYFPEITGAGEFERRETVLKSILPRAYKIVRESEAGKQELQAVYGTNPDKIIVVPQFPGELVHEKVEAKFEQELLQKYQLEKNKFIFYPAQFWAHKNHINLVKALQLLKSKGLKVKLVLTGSDKGTYQKVIGFIKRQQLQNDVVDMGFVTNQQLKILYKNALALVYPSMLGPTNMPIVEGLELACPVICSDHKGHQEQAEDAALYFNPADYTAIANQIEKVYAQEELRIEMIQKGLALCQRKYKIDKVFSPLINAFDEFENIRLNW